jgi:bifunctional enzyme CysN/CysC
MLMEEKRKIMISGMNLRRKYTVNDNLTWHDMDITREFRAHRMEQKPLTLWFTGLSGAGKSTLANEVEKELSAKGMYTMLLDGDNIRLGLNKDLGFSENDRIENIRRIAEVSKLMNDAGLIVLTSFISPYREDRRNAKNIIGVDNFIEIYISTPLDECERRDVKGLYKKARLGQISNFTGISAPYEKPDFPNISVDTSKMNIDEATSFIVDKLEQYI